MVKYAWRASYTYPNTDRVTPYLSKTYYTQVNYYQLTIHMTPKM